MWISHEVDKANKSEIKQFNVLTMLVIAKRR